VTIEALRRQRWTGQQIAVAVGVSPATISRILRRLGLNRIQALDPATPVRRYEREHPGELIHIDIKKLGRFDRVGHRITGDRTGQSKRRGVGWEFVHVCIDDASRVAFSQILPDEKKESAVAFLKATVAYYANLGVTITRVMTDNGSCFPMAPAFAPRPSALPAAISVSSTSGPSPIRPRQTARLSALSRPPCANGPTLRPTPPRTTAPLRCRSGCTDTTGTGRTAV
jgi:Integrase core domain